MKRKIIFRGKSVCDGSWVTGDLIGVSSDFGGAFIRRKYNDSVRVDPDTVGQYIGMTDCEGREIFEGDIIRWADITEYEDYLNSKLNPDIYEGWDFRGLWSYGMVYYAVDDDYPAFVLSGWDEDECNWLPSLAATGVWHYEVIGNIFDNPDMLPDAPVRGE